MDASVTNVMENIANQQSSIQQLNTLLSNSVSTSMEVCVCMRVCELCMDVKSSEINNCFISSY